MEACRATGDPKTPFQIITPYDTIHPKVTAWAAQQACNDHGIQGLNTEDVMILVVGSTGLVGNAVCQKLIERG